MENIDFNANLINQTRTKALEITLLISLILAICLIPVNHFVGSTFPNHIVALGIFLLYLAFKVTKSNLIIGNFLSFLMFAFIWHMSYKTGGIYSRDLASLTIAPIIALTVVGVRSSMFWILSIIALNFYFLKIQKDPTVAQYNQNQINQFEDVYFFALNLVGVILPLIFLFILTNLNNRMFQRLTKGNALLDQKNDLLEKQRIELENKTEDLKNVNNKLEKYAHTISHDLKQPLRTIHSFTTLLNRETSKEDADKNRISEFSNFITQGTKRIHSKVDELLNFAKNSRLEQSQYLSVKNIIDKVCFDLDALFVENNIEIAVAEMPILYLQSGTLDQVFQNIISNAIKYKKKDIPLTLDIRYEDRQDHCIFIITDNGVGIKNEDLTEIFQYQQQTHNFNPGQGIGLYICQEIINSYNGEIWVESEYGAGSSFYISLPKSGVKPENTVQVEENELKSA